MPLTTSEQKHVRQELAQLNLDSADQRIEDFVSVALGLNALQRITYFPTPDPQKRLQRTAAIFGTWRERVLRHECSIPEFLVYKNGLGEYHVTGLRTYLASKQVAQRLLNRLPNHAQVRSALMRIEKGHRLEAVAAAILTEQCEVAHATAKSADQGIDAIAWKEFLPLEACFVDGDLTESIKLPGENVYVLASSKAVEKIKGKGQPTLNPAHVRELVGSWVIQRTSAGVWASHGLKMLTPMQMVLVTTYRVSADAKRECRELGVQIWSLPELVYLVCLYAPDDVFPAQNGFQMEPKKFRSWWEKHDAPSKRLVPA